MARIQAFSVGRTLGSALLVGAGCYAGAAIGTMLQFPEIGTAALFAPYAVLTSALLLSPPHRWWIYLLAASLGNFWPHHADGAPFTFVLMAEIANHARALIAAYGVRRFGDAEGRFDTLRGMSVFLLFAVVLGPVIAAFIGAGVVHLHHGDGSYWLAWRPWLLSNTLTGLTLLPVIVLSVAKGGAPASKVAWPRLFEAGVLALALVTVGCWVLFEPSHAGSSLPAPLYAPVPLLLWAAVRFGPRGTSASLLVVALLAIWGALDGRGPFVTESPAGLVHLQLFLLALSVPLLLLSALLQEQRRTSEALRESRRLYRTVVEDQTELICRFRPDGTLTFVNGACCKSLDRVPEELLGTSFWDLFVDGRAAKRESVGRLCPREPVATWERELTTNGREPTWEQWKVRAIFDDRDRVVDYQAVGLNVTERKKAEQQHQLLQEERALAEALREADRRKNEFLAMVSHELRNPLAPISMVLEVMRLKPSNAEQVRWARELIGRQVAQLTRLVDDLLDLSRMTGGNLQVRMATIDLCEVITHAIETSRPLIEARAIDLVSEIEPSPLCMMGDAARLTQLISNLLNNAAKYTDVGGRVRLTVVRDRGEIVMRFADDGAGIPQHMLHRVFEPFAQVDRSRDGALGGLGLGLTLVKRLAEMHGGTVRAHSDGPGRGSEFVVRLPTEEGDMTSPADARRERVSTIVQPSFAVAPGRRVLVVDDAVDAAESLALLLTLRGHKVDVAHDGLSALDAALRLGPEVVFLDLGLPKMDGLEVARRLRSRFEPARMLLVATTGFGYSEDRRRTSEAGFDHHLLKPIDPNAVESLLMAHAPA